MKQIVCINRDETLRMKLKRCKTQDVAYQDEKLRMLQIGALKMGAGFCSLYRKIHYIAKFTISRFVISRFECKYLDMQLEGVLFLISPKNFHVFVNIRGQQISNAKSFFTLLYYFCNIYRFIKQFKVLSTLSSNILFNMMVFWLLLLLLSVWMLKTYFFGPKNRIPGEKFFEHYN